MKIVLKVFLFAVFISAVSPLAMAQWPDFPGSAPKTADGKVNMEGPTPKTPDGKPDLSGIWSRGGGQGLAPAGGQRGQGAPGNAPPAAGRGGQRGAAAGPPPVPPLPPDGIPIATFGNAGQGIQGDLPFQPEALELMKKRRADNSKDNPDAHCLPMGFMQF